MCITVGLHVHCMTLLGCLHADFRNLVSTLHLPTFLQNDDVTAHTSSLVGNPRPQSGDCPTAPCKRVAAVAIQVVGDVLLVIGDVV